jgi:hypothetical protein
MSEYLPIVALLILGVGAVGLVYAVSFAVQVERDPLRSDAFLSGTPAHEHAFSRFHVRWSAVALLFLAFDLLCPHPAIRPGHVDALPARGDGHASAGVEPITRGRPAASQANRRSMGQ